MRKVGTFASAFGLIYLGVWMIIDRVNPVLGSQVFKFWPIIIILLGLEVLIHYNRKGAEKTGVNGLIIPLLIVLLLVNVYHGTRNNFINFFNHGIRFNINESHNSKSIAAYKLLPQYGKRLNFIADHAKLNIVKSEDTNIKIQGNVYVDDDNLDEYSINAKKDINGYVVELNEGFINGAELDIYIPDGYDVYLNSDSLELDSTGYLNKSSFYVETSSCNIDTDGIKAIDIKMDSGSVKLDDVKKSRIETSSGNINIGDGCEEIYVRGDSGNVDIKNSVCKNVDIGMDSGMVTIKTSDENLKFNVNMDSGVCEINSERLISSDSNVEKIFGNGLGNVKIKMGSGALKFRNK